MSTDPRSIIRNLEDLSQSGQIEEVFERANSSIQEFDKSRDYEASIKVLSKLIDVTEDHQLLVRKSKIVAHIKVRYLLLGNDQKAKEYRKNSEYESPLDILLDGILEEDLSDRYLLENIEYQSIFGDFINLPHIPQLEVEDQQEIINLIDEYYEEGKYIINIVDKETSLHQSINHSKGKTEEVNVIEREKIYQINEK